MIHKVKFSQCIEDCRDEKTGGVGYFVFTPACCINDIVDSEEDMRKDNLDPHDTFAPAIVRAEQLLVRLTGENFIVISMFSDSSAEITNCMRQDLTLEYDMGVASERAYSRTLSSYIEFPALNAGSIIRNCHLKKLARSFRDIVPQCQVALTDNVPLGKLS